MISKWLLRGVLSVALLFASAGVFAQTDSTGTGGYSDSDQNNPGSGGSGSFSDGDMGNPNTGGSGGYSDDDMSQKKTYSKGDVNGDGKVNIADVSVLINILRGKATDKYGTADVSGDTYVTKEDIDSLIKIILKRDS